MVQSLYKNPLSNAIGVQSGQTIETDVEKFGKSHSTLLYVWHKN